MSERIDVNKTNGLCECIIYYYQYFPEINFRSDRNVYNGCHDLMQKAMSFNDVAIAFIKEKNFRIYFHEAINLLRNTD